MAGVTGASGKSTARGRENHESIFPQSQGPAQDSAPAGGGDAALGGQRRMMGKVLRPSPGPWGGGGGGGLLRPQEVRPGVSRRVQAAQDSGPRRGWRRKGSYLPNPQGWVLRGRQEGH